MIREREYGAVSGGAVLVGLLTVGAFLFWQFVVNINRHAGGTMFGEDGVQPARDFRRGRLAAVPFREKGDAREIALPLEGFPRVKFAARGHLQSEDGAGNGGRLQTRPTERRHAVIHDADWCLHAGIGTEPTGS